jgi:hypothetical protein
VTDQPFVIVDQGVIDGDPFVAISYLTPETVLDSGEWLDRSSLRQKRRAQTVSPSGLNAASTRETTQGEGSTPRSDDPTLATGVKTSGRVAGALHPPALLPR